jgi:hypothetical protein
LGFTAILDLLFWSPFSPSSVQLDASRGLLNAGTTAPFSAPFGTTVGTSGCEMFAESSTPSDPLCARPK